MRLRFGWLVAWFGFAATAYGQSAGVNLSTGVGGGVNLPGRNGPGAAAPTGSGVGAATALEQRAAISVGSRGPADTRQVGPNFNSARMGAGLGVGGSVEGHRMGASAAGAAGFQSRRDDRFGGADRRGPEGRRPDERPDQRPDERPEDRPEGAPPRGEADSTGAPRREPAHDPRLLPPLDIQNRAALQADLFLANRLAEIDRLRDVAVSNNDSQMLLRADHLEMEARGHHEVQVRGAAAAAVTPDRMMMPPQAAVGSYPGNGAWAAGSINSGATQWAPGPAVVSGNATTYPATTYPSATPGRLVPFTPDATNGAVYGEGAYELREFPAQAAGHASAQGQAHASANARPFMPQPVYMPQPAYTRPHDPTAAGMIQAGYSPPLPPPAAPQSTPPTEPSSTDGASTDPSTTEARPSRDNAGQVSYLRRLYRQVGAFGEASATVAPPPAPAPSSP